MTAPDDARRVVLDRRTRVLHRGGTTRILGGDPVTLVTPAPRVAVLLDGDAVPTGTAAGAALARALTDRGMAHPDVGGPDTRELSTIAVVIPVHDDAAGVAAVLDSLASELARGMRVVVVDDGSTVAQATTQATTQATPSAAVRVVRHEHARGPAAARNTGTAVAVSQGAEVVVYLDADVLPQPGWLGPLLRHLDDPRVAAVAPRIVAAVPGRFWVRGYETARSALDMGHEPARVRPRTRVAYVPSAALAVRPDRLPPVPGGAGPGPFDERLRVAEDVDLCWRTDRAGGLIRYEPASRVAHRHRTALAPLLQRRAFYGTGAAPLADRHGAAVAPAVAAPWSLAVALGFWSGTPAGLLVAAGAWIRAWGRTRALTGDGRAAAEVVSRGSVASIRQLPEALLRPYWPLAALALVATARSRSPVARGLRRRVALAAVSEGLWHWWAAREPGRMPVDEPLGHVILHRLDDLAYGVGVWRSAWAVRSLAALRPELKR
ncbi:MULTISPECIES: mycofactocin biosynthesis glycosyltransferase MftF [unclassified Dietzia]|uniref:mycofactocin biosynthesis glycosyltransferase MftF n=1 Tax=unclassified Dietzia TaxID=2617939 RepID=UPI000D21FFE7|nr:MULTISPECIES: mycofactocin biosynthesis glycosyltransferase MftF [unclassified Dietzia]AVZ40003.1 mycofactocin system glycosyltransferase [Dietzia sp. JS16-p6b]QGW25418.1 glycosyl transferase family 2 [Dietzia sp. DQ12-45-1b]